MEGERRIAGIPTTAASAAELGVRLAEEQRQNIATMQRQQATIGSLKKEVADLRKQISDMEAEFGKQRAALNIQLEATKAGAEKQRQAATMSAQSQVQSIEAECDAKTKAAHVELDRIRGLLAECDARIKSREASESTLRKEADAAVGRAAVSERELQRVASEAARARDDLKAAEGNLQQLSDERDRAHEDLKAREAELAKVTAERDAALQRAAGAEAKSEAKDATIAKLREEQPSVTSEEKATRADLEEALGLVEELRGAISEKQTRIETLERIPDQRDTVRQLEMRLAETEKQLDATSVRLEQCRVVESTVSDLKGENDALQQKIKDLSARIDQQRAQIAADSERFSVELAKCTSQLDECKSASKVSPQQQTPPPQLQQIQPQAHVQPQPPAQQQIQPQAPVAEEPQMPELEPLPAESSAQVPTHDPLFDKARRVKGSRTISPGSLKADMLGTACDLSSAGKHKTQPEGCFTDVSKEGECSTPGEAVRGVCKLHRIAVPNDSPLGGTDPAYEVFRALDPGTQIKLHLHKARSYWSQGIDIMVWTSNRTISRWLGRLSDPKNTVITREMVRSMAPYIDLSREYDTLLAYVKNARGMSQWDQIAPEYDNLMPEAKQYDGMANQMTVQSDGGYEPYPLWYRGEQNAALVPNKYTKNPSSSFRTGRNAVDSASRHLFYAMIIATFYAPADPSATTDGRVPHGSMTFLTPSEMLALSTLLRVLTDADPSLLSRRPMSSDTPEERVIYSEILRFLVAKHRETDLPALYQWVISNTAEAKGAVARFMTGLRELVPGAAHSSNAAKEVVAEGGRAYMRAMR